MSFVSPCNYLIFLKKKQIYKSYKKYFARWLISGFKTKKNEDTLSTFILFLLYFILVREEMPNDDAKNDKDAISVMIHKKFLSMIKKIFQKTKKLTMS